MIPLADFANNQWSLPFKFFAKNTSIHLSTGVWMLLLLPPILALCTIRRLNVLAPFALVANVIYLLAVAIVVYYFFERLQLTSAVAN